MLALIIIGRILLAVVLAAAVLLCLVLFVPVRYQVDGRIEDRLQMKAALTWLLHFAGLTVIVKGDKIKVRLHLAKFRRTIYSSEAPKKEQKKNVPDEKKEEEGEKPEKVRKIFEMLKAGKDFLAEKENRKLIKKILQKLKYVLKHLIPQKIKTNLRFSAGAPDTTGKVTGVISMIPVVYQYEIGLYPDFEADTPYILGTFHVKGHIRLVHIAVVAVSLLTNKKIRSMIKEVKKSAKGDGIKEEQK